MSYNAHTEEYLGFTIKIQQDDDATSPADWDQAATIYTKRNRHFNLGEDVEGYEAEDGQEALPVYAYVHGGVALSTGAFNCAWDSGQCGVIRMTREKIISEYGDDSEASREKARALMRAEISAWDDYFQGNVYGFVIENAEGEHVDSCWGFYGDYNAEGGALAEAKSIAEHHARKAKRDRQDLLKRMIWAGAPLDIRAKKLNA